MGLASLFVLGAFNKIANFDATAVRMNDAGLAFTLVLLPAAICLELVGGMLVALNLRWSAIAAICLAAYTILINGIFHQFWTLEEPFRVLELSLFFKNISIAGALLMVASGAFSNVKNEEGDSL